jgi:DNA recombination protein RmuC
MPLATLVIVLAALGAGIAVGVWFGSRLAASERRAEKAQSDAALQAAQAQIEPVRQQAAELLRLTEELRNQVAEAREKAARAETEAARLPEMRTALDASEVEKARLREVLSAAQAENKGLATQLDNERQNAQEKLQMLLGAREELTNQFKTLAQSILEEKSKVFTEQNQANLGNLLTPIREKFNEFQQEVDKLRDQGIKNTAELGQQIKGLSDLNQQLSKEANSLVEALKGSSKTQGDWGEFILEQILESAGLQKDRQYRVQESFTRDDGTRAQPDMIVSLPEGKHLIVDSKVSLRDYSDYCSAEEDAGREGALQRHLAAMQSHIKELSRRNYHTLYGLRSIDFVVMFVPIEPAYMLALAHDSSLWQKAWEQNVLLVGPSTLLFVVRTVAQLWRQEQQTKNTEEIARRGAKLYDKLAAFVDDLKGVGDQIDKARSSFDSAYRKLATDGGSNPSLIRQAEMLRQLGVKTTKKLPGELVEMARGENGAAEMEGGQLSLAAAADDESSEDGE